MTEDDFRKLALSFPAVVESAHMRHPDFRVGGKIFATLGYPDKDSAMVKLTRQEQKEFVRTNPGILKPVKGALGPARKHKHLFTGGKRRDCTQSARRSMARHRAEMAIEECLTQPDRSANTFHHLIGNFVRALCAAGEDTVDIRFVA